MKKIVSSTLLLLALICGGITALASSAIDKNNDCISAVFKAQEDDWTGVLALYSNCTFKFTEREGGDVQTTDGTYSIDGEVYPGSLAHITFYVNGENYGTATIAWPTEEGLQVLMNGYAFYKI